MAKKGYAWVFTENKSNSSVNVTPEIKKEVEDKFAAYIENLKATLQPIPEPQDRNYPIDYYGKWNRNFYYIWQKMKCGPDAYKETFEWGIARLKYVGKNQFDLCYYRHTEKWEPLFMYEGISLEACLKAVQEDDWFQVY